MTVGKDRMNSPFLMLIDLLLKQAYHKGNFFIKISNENHRHRFNFNVKKFTIHTLYPASRVKDFFMSSEKTLRKYNYQIKSRGIFGFMPYEGNFTLRNQGKNPLNFHLGALNDIYPLTPVTRTDVTFFILYR